MAQTLPKDVLNLPMFEGKPLVESKGRSAGSVWMMNGGGEQKSQCLVILKM